MEVRELLQLAICFVFTGLKVLGGECTPCIVLGRHEILHERLVALSAILLPAAEQI